MDAERGMRRRPGRSRPFAASPLDLKFQLSILTLIPPDLLFIAHIEEGTVGSIGHGFDGPYAVLGGRVDIPVLQGHDVPGCPHGGNGGIGQEIIPVLCGAVVSESRSVETKSMSGSVFTMSSGDVAWPFTPPARVMALSMRARVRSSSNMDPGPP